MGYRFDLKNDPDVARARKRFQNRAWYARNRERVLARHRAWRDNNPGYDAQFMRDKRGQNETDGTNTANASNIGSVAAN